MWIDMLNAVKSVLTDVSSVSPSSEHIWYLISVYGIYGREPITAPGRSPYSFQEVCEFFNVPYIGLVKVERLGQQLNIPTQGQKELKFTSYLSMFNASVRVRSSPAATTPLIALMTSGWALRNSDRYSLQPSTTSFDSREVWKILLRLLIHREFTYFHV